MKKLIAISLILMSSIVMAENIGWRDQAGNSVPNTDAMKNINGFGGLLVVTPDKDWKEKWNTPAENIPHFNKAKDVDYGQELTVLIFFSNPKADDKGLINITCDIQVVRPDETYSVNSNDVNCANWQAPPDQYKYNLQLTQTIIRYVGEPSDLPGTWKVLINLKDKNSGIEVPLKTEFHLTKKSTNKLKHSDGASAAGV
ncbi:hypothetical protein [Gynuella sunshinyii]|uniref:DUF3859 domain-containing protein n=1 Tax=Gynuella sunshinyii YC6258 TaxID=1445510 RepID=A0A0C5VKP2_9GAMM|nr:hypothetical protein [Gynuella sunshinyii]AJQ94861.1 hypothetical Protein YC6258_02823 [Gynuella sunshinyii YC6258]